MAICQNNALGATIGFLVNKIIDYGNQQTYAPSGFVYKFDGDS
jgi:hypothetical protein